MWELASVMWILLELHGCAPLVKWLLLLELSSTLMFTTWWNRDSGCFETLQKHKSSENRRLSGDRWHDGSCTHLPPRLVVKVCNSDASTDNVHLLQRFMTGDIRFATCRKPIAWWLDKAASSFSITGVHGARPMGGPGLLPIEVALQGL